MDNSIKKLFELRFAEDDGLKRRELGAFAPIVPGEARLHGQMVQHFIPRPSLFGSHLG